MERYYKRKIDHVVSESSSVTKPTQPQKPDCTEVMTASDDSEESETELSETSSVEGLVESLSVKLPHHWDNDYDALLSASVHCARFILKQGLDFDGFEEFDQSRSQGTFLNLLNLKAEYNERLKDILSRKSPETLKLMTLDARKDIITACANETTDAIVREIGDGLFSVFFAESRDVSWEYHIAVVLRYVDKKGFVVERFLGIKPVADNNALTYKKAVEDLLSSKGLSISRLRGQSYDVTSDKQVQLNGLKTLIMEENQQAYYLHNSSHQLQSAVMSVAYNQQLICGLVLVVHDLLNVIGARYKNQDTVRDERSSKVTEALKTDKVTNGFVLNKASYLTSSAELLQRSYHGTFVGLITMFSDVLDVLEDILDHGYFSEDRGSASRLLHSLQTFDFIFSLHLMRSIFGVTNDLALAIQGNDKDIVNATKLVQVAKEQFQILKNSGWGSFMDEVKSFCGNNFIDVPDMDGMHMDRVALKLRKGQEMTNDQFYHVGLFDKVIDLEVEDLNDRFNKVNMELLHCAACFSPSDSFVAFDKKRLIQFAEFYPKDFSAVELLALPDELENFITDARSCAQFSNLKGVDELARVMIETGRDTIYPLVYRLLTLALILPVSPAKVERASSSINTMKKWLCNQTGDQMMFDSLVAYLESEMFRSVPNEAIMNRFRSMEGKGNRPL